MNLADRYVGIASPEKLRHLREILDEAEKRQNEAHRHERERAQSLSHDHKPLFTRHSVFFRLFLAGQERFQRVKTETELLSETGLHIEDEMKPAVSTYLQLKDTMARVDGLKDYLERIENTDVSMYVASPQELDIYVDIAEESKAKVRMEIGQAAALLLDLEGILQERIEKYLFGRTLEKDQDHKSLSINRRSRATTDRLRKRDSYPTPSTDSYQATRHAISHNTFAEADESTYPTAKLSNDHIAGKIQLLPPKRDAVISPDPESLLVRSMWEHREQLSELTVDYLDALFAVWIEQATDAAESAVVCLDDLLRLRGLRMNSHGRGRRSGFKQKQRNQVLEEIERIECIYLDVIEYKGHIRKREHVVQSRALVVTDREGQRRLDGGVDVEHIVYQPGKIFGQYLQTKGRQTALLSAKALEYHPQKEDVEKRLTRYLSWQWRIRSRSISYGQPYKVQTLLDIAKIPVRQRNAYRSIDRLQKALDRLQSDAVIAAWQFEPGWDDQWPIERKLDSLVEIEPSEVIKVSYLSIFKKPQRQLHSEAAAGGAKRKHLKRDRKGQCANKESFGKLLRNKRSALQLSQMQLAELFNTSQATVARAESDAKISAEILKAMKKWLTE